MAISSADGCGTSMARTARNEGTVNAMAPQMTLNAAMPWRVWSSGPDATTSTTSPQDERSDERRAAFRDLDMPLRPHDRIGANHAACREDTSRHGAA